MSDRGKYKHKAARAWRFGGISVRVINEREICKQKAESSEKRSDADSTREQGYCKHQEMMTAWTGLAYVDTLEVVLLGV